MGASRRRGRPSVPPEDQRSVRNVWYSEPATRARFEAWAERAGLSLSTATDHLVRAGLIQLDIAEGELALERVTAHGELASLVAQARQALRGAKRLVSGTDFPADPERLEQLEQLAAAHERLLVALHDASSE